MEDAPDGLLELTISFHEDFLERVARSGPTLRMFVFTDLDDETHAVMVFDQESTPSVLALAADAWPTCNYVLLNGGNEKRITCVVAPDKALAISTEAKKNWRGKNIGDENKFVMLDESEKVVGLVRLAMRSRGGISPERAIELLNEMDSAAIMDEPEESDS